MTNVVVASYNTSFASDLGRALGSEGNFLAPRDNTTLPFGEKVSRDYFNNAIKQVKDFFEEYKKDAVIGLQEINWVTDNNTNNNSTNRNQIIENNNGYVYEKTDLTTDPSGAIFPFGKVTVEVIFFFLEFFLTPDGPCS